MRYKCSSFCSILRESKNILSCTLGLHPATHPATRSTKTNIQMDVRRGNECNASHCSSGIPIRPLAGHCPDNNSFADAELHQLFLLLSPLLPILLTIPPHDIFPPPVLLLSRATIPCHHPLSSSRHHLLSPSSVTIPCHHPPSPPLPPVAPMPHGNGCDAHGHRHSH